MKITIDRSLLAVTAGLLGWAFGAAAMTSNMNLPYAEKCSPPCKPELVFYSHQSEDLLFAKEDTIEITCQAGLRNVGLTWTLARNMFAKPFREGVAEALPPNRFRIRLATAGLHPGFYDLRVKLDVGLEKTVDGICTFGFKAMDMPLQNTRPADFTKFWDEAKAKLAKIPLAAQESPLETFTAKQINEYNLKSAGLPPDYDAAGHKTEEVESCKVTFAGPDGGRVYGWLAKPKGPGPFPALLLLPGAGFRSDPRPLEQARHGYVALEIQVHGQDVDLPKYDKLPGYYDNAVFAPVSAYYYYNIHLRCLQAIHYLASRPDVDAGRMAAAGGSQGGRLSIVVAGLDPRIKAIVSSIANSPNQPYLKWTEFCNPQKKPRPGEIPPPPREVSDGMDLVGPPPLPDTPENRAMAYYDPMNYAPDIHGAALFNAGLIDPVSPPSSVFGAYLRLGTADKHMIPLPGLAHDWSSEFDRRAWRWLDERLGPGKK